MERVGAAALPRALGRLPPEPGVGDRRRRLQPDAVCANCSARWPTLASRTEKYQKVRRKLNLHLPPSLAGYFGTRGNSLIENLCLAPLRLLRSVPSTLGTGVAHSFAITRCLLVSGTTPVSVRPPRWANSRVTHTRPSPPHKRCSTGHRCFPGAVKRARRRNRRRFVTPSV